MGKVQRWEEEVLDPTRAGFRFGLVALAEAFCRKRMVLEYSSVRLMADVCYNTCLAIMNRQNQYNVEGWSDYASPASKAQQKSESEANKIF